MVALGVMALCGGAGLCQRWGEVSAQPPLCSAISLSSLPSLQAKHTQEGSQTWGVNGESGALADMKELGVWEPLAVKLQTYKTAVEVRRADGRTDVCLLCMRGWGTSLRGAAMAVPSLQHSVGVPSPRLGGAPWVAAGGGAAVLPWAGVEALVRQQLPACAAMARFSLCSERAVGFPCRPPSFCSASMTSCRDTKRRAKSTAKRRRPPRRPRSRGAVGLPNVGLPSVGLQFTPS